MNAPHPNLPAGLRTADLPADEAYPGLDDWAEACPDTYCEAVDAVFDGELAELLDDARCRGGMADLSRFVRKLEKKLDEEIDRGAAWIENWRSRMED
ncbi:MAG TPA: hypothetical protein VEA69_16625 [Tepidisphaeraceae bacterium]|nr:hypothetical protein [Tepidisphaeraceae bacterium]